MDDIRNLSQLISALEKGYKVRKQDQEKKVLQYAAHNSDNDGRHFCVMLAGHVIEINTLYTEVYHMCKDYLCNDHPEIIINICDKDIERERIEINKTGVSSSNSYLETLAVYRKICTALLEFETFLMHGAVVGYKNNAFMFTAQSGTGKTTHIQKWLDRLDDAYVINGDKPLISIRQNEILTYGTPWCGKEKMGSNIMVPLKAVVLMERGEDNQINEITFGEAFAFLLQQTYQPEGTDNMKKTLQLLSKMKGRIHFYRFIFNNMKDDAFDVSYKALTGELI